MDADVDVSLVASLLADRTRAVFVDAMIERHALTADELAQIARVTPSAASTTDSVITTALASTICQGSRAHTDGVHG